MPSGKLHLKETPAERVERELRKARKAARKAARAAHRYEDEDEDYDEDRLRKRARTSTKPETVSYDHVWHDDSETEYGPQPDPNFDRARKEEEEEERFREKLYDAMDADAFSSRLDSIEAEMNAYGAHIPKRWRSNVWNGTSRECMEEGVPVDPNQMEEEEYAEWMRAAMWRRKNPDYLAEKERQEAERKARKAREKAIREETRRLEREAEEERGRKRARKEVRKMADAKYRYERGWAEVLESGKDMKKVLHFVDVPWPVKNPPSSPEDITDDAIATFLFSDKETKERTRKDIIRATLLRFHPDKFEGRVLGLVEEGPQREMARKAVGKVVRALNELMARGT